MMLAAVMPTFRLSTCSLSWLAISAQRSARAGEAASAHDTASVAASRISRRNGRRNFMVAAPQLPESKPQAGRECKSEAKKPINENAKESCTDRGHETFPLAEKGLERCHRRTPSRGLPALKPCEPPMNAPSAFPDPQKPVPPYKHTPLFPLGSDTTPYKKITAEGMRVEKVLGKDMLVVSREALRALSEAAFGEINHYLRPGHLKQLRSILDDKEASSNDKFVALDFLKNANIAAGGVLPMCQDTGTAIIMGKKGCNVITDGEDEAALSEGARDAYLRRNLRYSQVAPLSMYEEKNTANNMPAQCEIYAEGDDAYKFMFMAKGGGSANKSFLFQATPSVLTKDRLLAFLKEKILTLGTAACPPYHLAIVIGGTSAELCMKTVKLASARYLDALPTQGSADGNAFRDLEMEQEIHKMTQSLGVGAQFGGKYFCHDVRVIRMPRHGASLPIGLGVSCSADRQVLGKITKDGVYLEELEHNPAQYLPQVEQSLGGEVVKIDLGKPMKEILATLSKYPVKTRLSLTGTMIVARDSAHAKLRERLEKGEPLPDYFKNHPIYY